MGIYNEGGVFNTGNGAGSGGGSGNTPAYRLVTASGAVTLTTSDGIVEIDQSGTNNITVNLPSSPTVGQPFTIKDGAFNGSTYILTPPSGNIDGASTYTMYGNGSSTDVFFNGTNWRIK